MITLAIIFGIFGGLISRWHGSTWPGGRVIKSIAWAVPIAVVCTNYSSPLSIAVSASIVLALCALGKATSHGGWMDMGTWKQMRRSMALEFLIKPLRGKIPEYWYDFCGLSLVGVAAVSGAVFVLPLPFSLLALVGGACKGISYAVGWHHFPKNQNNHATEIGEFCSGFYAYIGIASAVIMAQALS